jgi:hypothetical protein
MRDKKNLLLILITAGVGVSVMAFCMRIPQLNIIYSVSIAMAVGMLSGWVAAKRTVKKL